MLLQACFLSPLSGKLQKERRLPGKQDSFFSGPFGKTGRKAEIIINTQALFTLGGYLFLTK
jgi:hypothetical protein